MKLISILALSLLAISCSGQPLLRQAFTTNTTPWNDTTFTGTTIFDIAAGNSLGATTVSGSQGIFTSGLRYSPSATPGAFLQSLDVSGNAAWGAPVPIFQRSGDIAIDDFSLYTTTASAPSISGGYGFSQNGIVTFTSEIGSRQMLDGVTRNVLRILGKGEYIRPLPWGTNWTRVRVGVLLSITNGASFTNAFSFGLCANGTNGGLYGTACSNWWAIGTAGQAAASQTFSISNQLDVPFYDVTFIDRSVIRTNNTTVVTGSGSGTAPRAIGALPHFTILYLDFQRNLASTWPSTNVVQTIEMRGMTMIPAANAFVVTRRAGINSFVADLQNVNTTFTLASAAVQFANFTVNEKFWGQFDSVALSWGNNPSLAEVWAIAAVRLY